MNLRVSTLFLAFAAFLFLSACGSSVDLEATPEILYGQDVCTECGMIISDARFAASYTTTDGQVRVFDDIGDMLLHMGKKQEDVHIYWVHDFHSEAWINAQKATFVLNTDLATPMGWGLAAFDGGDDADAYAAEHGGTPISFDGLLAEVALGALDPAALASHVHGQHTEMDGEGEVDLTMEEEMEHDHDMEGEMDADHMMEE